MDPADLDQNCFKRAYIILKKLCTQCANGKCSKILYTSCLPS